MYERLGILGRTAISRELRRRWHGHCNDQVIDEFLTWRTEMTPTTETAKTTQTPLTRNEVKRMLRDAAFVLQMTSRVKAEMVAERPEASNTGARKAPEMSAGLGV
jgi:hypothetical protein